jgi:hypothetical protein
MKLARLGPLGSEQPGLIDADGKLRNLSSHIPDLTNPHLTDEALARLASIGAGRKSDPIFLTDGDRISLGVEGRGNQAQAIVAWEKRLKTILL